MATADEFKRAYDRAMKRAFSAAQMTKYGEFAAEMIKLRSRLGFGVSTEGGNRNRFAELSKSYKEERAQDRKSGKLSSLTTPNRSNLTRTGQMLESLGVKKLKDGEVKIGPKGKRLGESITNEEVGVFVSAAGRVFNNLSKTELKRLDKFIEDELERFLKEELK